MRLKVALVYSGFDVPGRRAGKLSLGGFLLKRWRLTLLVSFVLVSFVLVVAELVPVRLWDEFHTV